MQLIGGITVQQIFPVEMFAITGYHYAQADVIGQQVAKLQQDLDKGSIILVLMMKLHDVTNYSEMATDITNDISFTSWEQP